MRRGGSSESNRTIFHEWGAASPKNFIISLIRVHSLNSWLKCSAPGHPRRRVHWFSQRIRCLELYELEAPPLCYGAPIGSDGNGESKWTSLRTGETPMPPSFAIQSPTCWDIPANLGYPWLPPKRSASVLAGLFRAEAGVRSDLKLGEFILRGDFLGKQSADDGCQKTDGNTDERRVF